MPEDNKASSADLEEIISLVQRQFPGSNLYLLDTKWHVATVHGVGDTEEAALKAAMKDWQDMQRDGKALPEILSDVRNDLANSGMSRERHDSLHDLLNIASQSLDAGILTNTVPWIMRASYTREIEDLRRRVSTRLSMKALEMQQNEAARRNATKKFPRTARTVDGTGTLNFRDLLNQLPH
jgi:hypothetical protein